jgi:ferredoxin-NADP reductase/pSer/pThr/pTyr-binding forkhead associated (FHA) protein
MKTEAEVGLDDNIFWQKVFFAGSRSTRPLHPIESDSSKERRAGLEDAVEDWLNRLFAGLSPSPEEGEVMKVFRNGKVVLKIPAQELEPVTLIGRHPDADLQLESNKIAAYHAVILHHGGKFYLENLDAENGIYLNRKKLPLKKQIQLYDGAQIDFPCYRLEFSLAEAPPSTEENGALTEPEPVPEFFYAPPAPSSPLRVDLIEHLKRLKIWSPGLTLLRVVDIIDETHDCKTFRLAPVRPLLFSYKPGQYVTFILNIDGREVKRSYSMSSSPSRPHLLEVTVKRVPSGLVSNWFCNQVKLGDELTVKGPMGHFTCFASSSRKMLFIGAGSGIVPILSMSRWIADTAAEVDVKLLASFKSPQDIIFRKEFEMLSARTSGFQVAFTLTSSWPGTDHWTGFTGRINYPMLSMFVPDILERDLFLCGPDPFAQSISRILRDLGYDMSKYHTESFGSGLPAPFPAKTGETVRLKGALHKVHFVRSGITVDTDEYTTLLELAEAHGIEIDYSCRSGSCGECEVKCRGQVKIGLNCEIDEKTRNAGFVYTCSTTAASDLELDI